jgi:flagellar biosynthesis/type III secretory pathway ATPase
VRIGAYQKGSDSTLDKALALIPELDHFLMQKPGEAAPAAPRGRARAPALAESARPAAENLSAGTPRA